MELDFERLQRAKQTQLKAVDEAKQWIQAITGKPIVDFFEDLQSGVVLCELMNTIFPGLITRYVAEPKHPLEVRDNINSFLEACHRVGVPHQDLITLLDMGQRRDEIQLLQCISAVQRQAQAMGLKIPTFGPTYYRTVEDQEKIELRRKLEAQEFAKKREREERRSLARRTELEGQKLEKRQGKIEEAKEVIASRQNERIDIGKDDLAMHGSIVVLADLQKMEGSIIKYGYDLELEAKTEGHRDHQLEMDILDWIEDVTGEVVDHVWLHLKSGRKLCKLINKINPGMIPRINLRKIAIMERENIQKFLQACVGLGVPTQDLFEVDYLYKATNLGAVIHTLYCLAITTNRASDLQEAQAQRNSLRDNQKQTEPEMEQKESEIWADTTSSDTQPKHPPEPQTCLEPLRTCDQPDELPESKITIPFSEHSVAANIQNLIEPSIDLKPREDVVPVTPLRRPPALLPSNVSSGPEAIISPTPATIFSEPMTQKPIPPGLKLFTQSPITEARTIPRFRDSAHRAIVEGKSPTTPWAVGIGLTLLVAAPLIGFAPALGLVGGSYLAYNAAVKYFNNETK